MKYVFHPTALSEYGEAVNFYAESRVELAQAFINAIEDTIFRIIQSPNRWAIVEENIRRCLTRNFPYGILYTIEEDYILILAVMHCSREPGYWKERVQEKPSGEETEL
ncbi:type II toxin-antitoxin system RelE/ParE family toxin [Nostoc sp. 'Peltigera membranacea cyanobiont' N6]|uniref:type II toxin-antitoxin system RelE/ParE family toxin n=1 Tax=Nostoc sp. 'Peltigera membranacea cyanobiont' N6 TaxID=1261031 RepID=UPI000CF3521D|nr:type II toxin-antitoxin system RelE/ParE family toxin [Nostoc sp. 'Peltigera membranacea cyanobiont' N6]AVH67470.1 plasmid stabilization system protein ParE [Nostoc sp. 'Peltigera membranacea cyanobiont' N6]